MSLISSSFSRCSGALVEINYLLSTSALRILEISAERASSVGTVPLLAANLMDGRGHGVFTIAHEQEAEGFEYRAWQATEDDQFA